MTRFVKHRGAAVLFVLAAATLSAGSLAATGGGTHGLEADPVMRRVAIEANGSGFVPDTVRLVAGVPADLVFTRTVASGCVSQVHIPELGIGRTALPQGEPVTIRVQPKEPGTYEYRCGMDMRKGTIIVSPPR